MIDIQVMKVGDRIFISTAKGWINLVTKLCMNLKSNFSLAASIGIEIIFFNFGTTVIEI